MYTSLEPPLQIFFLIFPQSWETKSGMESQGSKLYVYNMGHTMLVTTSTGTYLPKSSLHTMQGILSESYLLRGGATYKPPTISTGINAHDNMSCCLYTTCEQTSGADRSRIRRNPRCQPNHRLYIDHVKDTHSNLPPVNSSATYF